MFSRNKNSNVERFQLVTLHPSVPVYVCIYAAYFRCICTMENAHTHTQADRPTKWGENGVCSFAALSPSHPTRLYALGQTILAFGSPWLAVASSGHFGKMVYRCWLLFAAVIIFNIHQK